MRIESLIGNLVISMKFIEFHVRNPTYRTNENSVRIKILQNSHLCNQAIYVPKCSNRIEAKSVSFKLKVIEAVKVHVLMVCIYTLELSAQWVVVELFQTFEPNKLRN